MSRTEDLTAELASLGDGATRDELLDWSKRAAVALRHSADREATVARADYEQLLASKQAVVDTVARVAALRDTLVGPHAALGRSLDAALGDEAFTAPTPTTLAALALSLLGGVEYGTAVLDPDGTIWDEHFGQSEDRARALEGPDEEGDRQIVAVWRPVGTTQVHRLVGPMEPSIADADKTILRRWADQLDERGYAPLAERVIATVTTRHERVLEAQDLDRTAIGWDIETIEGSAIGTIANVTRSRDTDAKVFLHITQDGLDGTRRISVPATTSVRLLEPIG